MSQRAIGAVTISTVLQEQGYTFLVLYLSPQRKPEGRGGGVSSFFSYPRLGRYWLPRKWPKSRFFGDDIADWLEGSELVRGR